MQNKLISLLLAIIVVALIVQLDIRDAFSHGYFTNSVKYESIEPNDIEGYVDISEQEYAITFTPIKDNFAGFVLYFANQFHEDTGVVELTVYESGHAGGGYVDAIKVKLSEVENLHQYKVASNKTLKRGKTYTVVISAKDCITAPEMILIDPDYITKECPDSNLLLGYAYKESTFNPNEKLLITLFLLCFLVLGISLLQKKRGYIYKIGIWSLLITAMAWNFSFNSLDNANTSFAKFDSGSENLVITTIDAERGGFSDFIKWGLNNYSDIRGEWYAEEKYFLTDSNWTEGYSNTEPKILLRSSRYVADMAVVGNAILFANGEQFLINEVSNDNTWITISLDSGRVLNYWKYGDLADARFIDTNGNILAKGYLGEYQSQFGLQGKIFRYLARIFDIDLLKTLCALATAITLVLIVYVLKKKYNVIFAGVFYCVFLLSPWIVNFANNLYWVEFTWFFPMLTGLFCSWKIEYRKYRVLSYILAYISILVKSLCGYEYISCIMMGLIAFLIVDFIMSLLYGNKERQVLLFKTIFILGIIALIGFFTAICIHSPNKSGANGSVIEGIKLIIQKDVLRRTYGGAGLNSSNLLGVEERYAGLASTWEVFCRYFDFKTEVVTGISGNLFSLLCIIPLVIMVFEKKKNKFHNELLTMYFVFFVTTISWFLLAKSHSYVHIFLNIVLWYFGYVQVCIYIIINKLIEILSDKA